MVTNRCNSPTASGAISAAAAANAAEEAIPGLGADAWRFLRRLDERSVFLRVAPSPRRGPRLAANIVRAARFSARPAPGAAARPGLHATRDLLDVEPDAALAWLAEGWIAPVGRVPGVVAYYALTARGRAEEERIRPAPELDVITGYGASRANRAAAARVAAGGAKRHRRRRYAKSEAPDVAPAAAPAAPTLSSPPGISRGAT